VKLDVPPAGVSREVLLAAMEGSILAAAELRVVYARSAEVANQSARFAEPAQKKQ
jgi:hypothetical protein